MSLRRCASQWNAYVESGATREERRARLEEVPEHMRESVEDHVRTVFILRSIATWAREIIAGRKLIADVPENIKINVEALIEKYNRNKGK